MCVVLHFRKITIIQLLAAVAVICLSASQSYAKSATYVFTGIVDINVSPEIWGPNTPYGFQLGQTITGSFTYDTDAVYPPSFIQTAGGKAWSDNYEAVTHFGVTVGSYTANGVTHYDVGPDANIVQVVNTIDPLQGDALDELVVGAPLVGPLVKDSPPYGALFFYTPMKGTDLAHVGNLNGAALESYSNWYISFGPNQQWQLAGHLTSIQHVPKKQSSEIAAAVPGNTLVKDPEGDLLLRNCNPTSPGIPCSLPPGAPLDLPGYFDIKTAKITQIGKGRVDLSIALHEPIPLEPPYGFVNYFWQFEGGCVTGEPGDKDAISIAWHGDTKTWSANWIVITNCNPRAIAMGDPIPFEFAEDGVKVRVALADLLTATEETGTLIWHAGVRRVPFIYTINTGSGPVQITHTVAVDYAPDVVELVPAPQYIDYPEEPATWEPR